MKNGVLTPLSKNGKLPSPRGIPHHRPTSETRSTVKKMVLLGSTRAVIAGALGISPETLEKHYHDTLNYYQAHMLSNVAGKAYGMALKGNPHMVMFVLRTRAGWRDNVFGEADAQLIKRVIGVRDDDI